MNSSPESSKVSKRRRVNIDYLAMKSLVALHGALFDANDAYVSRSYILQSLPGEPPNAVRIALDDLVQNEFVYEDDIDGFALTPSGSNRVDQPPDNQYARVLSEISNPPVRRPPTSVSDEWEPIPVDHSQREVKDAIEKSEAALKEIEQNNGYAATAPEERNAIVETIRGTLAALKAGFPSRQAIIAGLVAPFRYIAKKFGEATVGEAAKIAAAAIVKWLISPGG